MFRRSHVAFALTLSLTVACGLFEKTVTCTDELYPGIALELQDSVTGYRTGVGATVIAVDGAYADTGMTFPGNAIFYMAHERAGTYSVTAELSGYQKWTKTGVVVTKDECHVRTVSMTARLQR